MSIRSVAAIAALIAGIFGVSSWAGNIKDLTPVDTVKKYIQLSSLGRLDEIKLYAIAVPDTYRQSAGPKEKVPPAQDDRNYPEVIRQPCDDAVQLHLVQDELPKMVHEQGMEIRSIKETARNGDDAEVRAVLRRPDSATLGHEWRFYLHKTAAGWKIFKVDFVQFSS
jgi:hypothetical protein